MGAFVPSSDVQQQRSTLASIAVSSTRTDSAISQTSAIDISKWKSEVTKVLPPGCIVAKMILKEPDILARSEAEVKIPMYLRMIEE
jgi:tRNA U38,U39,U40 pseudouridine synthase TruA